MQVGEPFPCKQKDNTTGKVCGQMIIFHEGINKVVNFYNGNGGAQGDQHVCPYRALGQFNKIPIPNWNHIRELQSRKSCPTCAVTFYTTIFQLCPNCFKLQCRDCKRLRTWKINEHRCPICLCLNSDVIPTYPTIDKLIAKLRRENNKKDDINPIG